MATKKKRLGFQPRPDIQSGPRLRRSRQWGSEMSEIAPEIVERMVALVRTLAEQRSSCVVGYDNSRHEEEARAIVALLPEPIDNTEEA